VLGITTYLLLAQFVLRLPVVYSLALVLGAGFCLVVFLKPLWGYYALMASFGAEFVLALSEILTMTKFLGAVVFLSWALEAVFRRSYRFPRSSLLVLVPLFFATALLSTFPAEDIGIAGLRLTTLLQLGALVFITATIMQKPLQVQRVGWIILLSTLVSVAYGIASMRSGAQLALTGFAMNRNRFGVIIALCIPLVFYLYPRSGRLGRAVLLGLTGVFVMAEALTYSRGGFLAMLLSLVLSVLFVVHSQRLRLGVWIAVVVVGLIIAMPQTYWSRMGSIVPSLRGGTDTVGQRYQLWAISLKMIRDHPLLGVGAGNFTHQFARYSGIVSLRRGALVAHNAFLAVAAEQGIPGGLLFIALLLAAFVSLRRSYRWARDRGDDEVADLTICFSVILFILTTQCMKGNYEHTKYLWVALGMTVALQGMSGRDALPETEAVGEEGDPQEA
jgi:O-antigen ligase